MGGVDVDGRGESHVHGHDAGSFGAVDVDTARWVWVAVAVCAAATLIGLVVLWPDRSDRDTVVDPALVAGEPVKAAVLAAAIGPCSYDATVDCRRYRLQITSGEDAGTRFRWEQDIDSPLRAGDRILVTASRTGDQTTYSFWDYQRSTPMWILVGLFAAAVVGLGRWRGVGALAGLAASLGVLLLWALPSLLDGNDPVAVALVAASVVAFIALYLAHGVNVATSVALLSTFAALAITGLLAWAFVTAAHFTGLTEDATFFLNTLGVPIDARGILLAGIVIGSLGVLDDVTVTQVSAVGQLRHARPRASWRALYRSALSIGRDHISSTVNTLFLAYAGAALPLLLLFTEARQSVGSVATREIVATEIVRALVGSIGLVSAVPISTALAARVLTPRTSPTHPSTVRVWFDGLRAHLRPPAD
jgi:uncharacterized membrane protein